jgi:hypothetical protein
LATAKEIELKVMAMNISEFIIGTSLHALIHKTILLLFVISIAGVATPAQTKPENLFSPPKWILGEWANFSGPEPNKIERIAFSEHEIELVQGLADAGVKFSGKFKKYKVEETPGAETYRIVVSNSKEELIWEFTLCPQDKCNLMTGDALSYSFTKNKKKLWDHSHSLNKILMRRTRG